MQEHADKDQSVFNVYIQRPPKQPVLHEIRKPRDNPETESKEASLHRYQRPFPKNIYTKYSIYQTDGPNRNDAVMPCRYHNHRRAASSIVRAINEKERKRKKQHRRVELASLETHFPT